MKTIAFPCGYEEVHLDLPSTVQVLEPRPMPVLKAPEGFVARALADPLDSPPLSILAKGRKSACVVISDITRPVPNRVILPPLLKTLEAAGIERGRITILIATGTHRPNLGKELIGLVGDEVARNYTVVNHDCRNRDLLRRAGEIGGAAIEINTTYLDADLKILTGLIEPHPFAGYSGGAKSILPGVSSFETMKYMHAFRMIAGPNIGNGILEGNPFYMATMEAAQLAGVDFIVNAVINKKKEPCGFVAGGLKAAHDAGCRMAAELSVVRVEQPMDLVITSAGGAPLDATYIQCGKGILGAKSICRPGGTVILICGCSQGVGSETYAELIQECGNYDGFERRFSDPRRFVMDQWVTQCYLQALSRMGRVLVYTPGLTAEELRPLGVEKITELQAVVDNLLLGHPRVAAVPEGPYVVGLTGC